MRALVDPQIPPHPDAHAAADVPHTVALFSQPADADDSHDVRAPGGYEWWHFDAQDPRHGRRVVATVFDGLALHPRYVREYLRYRRRPTRVAPPLPERYRCAHVQIYERSDLRARALVLTGSSSEVMTRRDDGVTLRIASREIIVGLRFSPLHRHAPLELSLPSPAHRWVLASPLCGVEGEIRFRGGDPTLDFAGRGYRDHQYGTSPYAIDVARGFRGRVLLDDAAYAFHLVREARARTDVARLVEALPDRLAEVPVTRASCDWSRNARAGVAYPHAVALDEAIQLHNPRVIDSSALHARLVYDAVCRGTRCGEALCDAVHPSRLRLPIVARMIEKAIDSLAAETASSAAR